MRRIITEKIELESGDIVENKRKEKYLVVGDRLLSINGFVTLDNFNDDLTSAYHNIGSDIVKVYSVVFGWGYGLKELFDKAELKLEWEREDNDV